MILVVLCAALAALPGCKFWKSDKQHYETISASPSRDTAAAVKAHTKALKILDGHCHDPALKFAQAEAQLQKALVADVLYGPAHNTLGVIYMDQHKFYTAAWEFEYAAKLMPDRIEPIYNLGQLYEAAGKLDNAIVYYEQAMEMAPKDPAVIGSLVAIQLKNGQTVDEVRPLLESLVFADQRPEWIGWAQDLLGRKPIQIISSTTIIEHPPGTVIESAPNSQPKLIPDPELQSIPPSVPPPQDQPPSSIPSLQDVPPPPPPALNDIPAPPTAGRATMKSDDSTDEASKLR